MPNEKDHTHSMSQPESPANPLQDLARKPYSKPRVQAIVINSKNDVLGNCQTASTSSSFAGGCNLGAGSCQQ